MKNVLILSFILGLANLAWAADGVKLKASSKDLNSGKITESTIYINASTLVIKTNQQGTDADILYNATKEEITFIDHSRKEFSVIDKPTMKQLSAQLDQMVQMLKAFYDNMPPEQKKKFKPLIEGKPENINYNNLGSEQFNGWSTKKYEATTEGEKLLVTNIVNYSSVNLSKSDLAALPKLISLIEQNLSGIGAIVPSGSMITQWSGDDNPMFNEGIPVKTILYEDGRAKEETTIKSIEKSSFELSDFSIPSGYREQKIDLNAMGK